MSLKKKHQRKISASNWKFCESSANKLGQSKWAKPKHAACILVQEFIHVSERQQVESISMQNEIHISGHREEVLSFRVFHAFI